MSKLAQLLNAVSPSVSPNMVATVSALREDGTVNLTYAGGVVLGAVCLASYTPRAVGDRVHVAHIDGGVWAVLGPYRADTSYVTPPNKPNNFQQYDINANITTPLPLPQQAVSSSAPSLSVSNSAWFYYNGTANTLVTAASGKTKINVWLTRITTDGGVVNCGVELKPHGVDTGPSTLTLLTGFTPIPTVLQPGEVKIVSLPSDWVSAIIAGTIRGFAVVSTDPSTYMQFSTNTGGFSVA